MAFEGFQSNAFNWCWPLAINKLVSVPGQKSPNNLAAISDEPANRQKKNAYKESTKRIAGRRNKGLASRGLIRLSAYNMDMTPLTSQASIPSHPGSHHHARRSQDTYRWLPMMPKAPYFCRQLLDAPYNCVNGCN